MGKNGDYPCYIQVEYGTLKNYIDEDPLLTGDFEYTKNDLSNDVINGSLEIEYSRQQKKYFIKRIIEVPN